MKKLPLTWVLFLLISNLANGQYNTPISLSLREITPLEKGIFRIEEFRTDSSLAYRGYLSSDDPPVRYGDYDFFDNKGNMVVTGSYYQDIPIGTWTYMNKDHDTLRVINYDLVWDKLELEAEGITLDMSSTDSLPRRLKRSMNPDGTFTEPDEMPSLAEGAYGGSFSDYVSDSIVYPVFASMNEIRGWVETEFIVDKEGKVRYPVVLTSFNSDLSIEAVRMLYESPGWKPGTVREIPVNVKMNWTFTFPEHPSVSLVDNYEVANSPDSAGNVIFLGEEVFYIVEDMPKFNGGDPVLEFRKFIAMNLQYPESAAVNGIQGRVIVQFAIDTNGYVTDAKIVRSAGKALDREALRVVTSSPPWTPGRQRGEKVKVLFTFPINFTLQIGH